MATDLERLVVTIEARTKEYERALARVQQVTVGQLRRIEGAVTTSSRRMEARLGAAGSVLVRTFSGLLAGFSAREIISAADSFTRIENAIRLTGREGEELTSTMEELFDAARRHGAPVESLAQLYSRLGQVQGELGIKSEELTSFNKNVAAAIQVSGRTAEQSSGALLQFAQALGSGVVRAEEFNSILEGALPIAQAAARGLDAAGGSVAKLRQLVIEGQVSSKEFFDAFQRGAVQTQEQARSMELTVGQAWQSIATAAVEAIGKIDERISGTSSLSRFLQFFAESINVVSDALTGTETAQSRQNALLAEQARWVGEIASLELQKQEAIKAGITDLSHINEQLSEAHKNAAGVVAELEKLASQSPLEIEIRPTLPSVTRGVEPPPPGPEVQQIAKAIDSGFAKQEAEMQAIQNILHEGNISGAQRAVLLGRLATLQAANQSESAQIANSIKAGMQRQISTMEAIRAVLQQGEGTAAQRRDLLQQLAAIETEIYGAVVTTGAEMAAATQEGASRVTGAVNAVGDKVAQAVQQQATGFSTTVGVASTPQMNAIRQQQSALQAELTSLQTALQYKQLSDAEQRQAELRIAEIQIELAKLGEEMIAAEEGLRKVGEALIFLSSRSLLSAERLYQMAYRLAGLEAPPLPTARTRSGFAQGGSVYGAGTSKSDSIPAMLSNGEFVVNAAQTAKHRGMLEAINSGTLVMRMDGGLVARLNSSVQRLQSGGIVQRMPESMATSRDSGGKTTNISISLTGTDLQSIRGSERAMARKFAREIAYELEQL